MVCAAASRSASSARPSGRSSTARPASSTSGPGCGCRAPAARSGATTGGGGPGSSAPTQRGAITRIDSGEVRAKLAIGDGDLGRVASARPARAPTSGPASGSAPIDVDVAAARRPAGPGRRCAGSRTSRPATTRVTPSGAGRRASAPPTDGRAVGWNLVEGVNDPPQRQRAGDLGRGRAGPARARAGPLRRPRRDRLRGRLAARLRRPRRSAPSSENKLVVRYSYRQPFGTFSGSLDGIELAEGIGVMEHHDAVW